MVRSQGILNFDVAMPQSRNLVVQRNESPLKALMVGGLAGTVETLTLQPLVYLKTFQQVQGSVVIEPLSMRTMYVNKMGPFAQNPPKTTKI